MTVTLLAHAEADLEEGFDYYEAARAGLGAEFVTEFRRAVDRILAHPRGWHAMDAIYRRCQLHRFPYGVIYRIDDQAQQIVVVAVMHMRREPDHWRKRLP